MLHTHARRLSVREMKGWSKVPKKKGGWREALPVEGIFNAIVDAILKWVFNQYKRINPTSWRRFVRRVKRNQITSRMLTLGIGSIINGVVKLFLKLFPFLGFIQEPTQEFLEQSADSLLLYASQQTVPDEEETEEERGISNESIIEEFVTTVRSNLSSWRDALALFFLPIAGLFRGHHEDRDLHLFLLSIKEQEKYRAWVAWATSLSEEDQAYISRFYGPLSNDKLLEQIMGLDAGQRMPFIRLYAGKGVWQMVEDVADAIGEPLEQGLTGISTWAQNRQRAREQRAAAGNRRP